MKRKSLFLLCVLSLFIISAAYPRVQPYKNTLNDTTRKTVKENDEFIMDIRPDSNSEKFVLLINNTKNEKLMIQIVFPDGGLYNEWTSSSVFCKRYDLTNTDDGTYTITVSNCRHKLSRSVNLYTRTETVRHISVK